MVSTGIKMQLCDKCIRLTSKAKYIYLQINRKNIIFPQDVQGAEGSGPGQESL